MKNLGILVSLLLVVLAAGCNCKNQDILYVDGGILAYIGKQPQ